MKKKLLIFTLVCLFAVPAFAEQQNDTDKNKNIFYQYVVKNKTPEVTADYINSVYELAKTQYEEFNTKDAIKTAEYLVPLSEKFYGKDAVETLKARIIRGKIVSAIIMAKESKEDFNYVLNAAKKNNNAELTQDALSGLANLYMTLEQSAASLNYKKQIKYDNLSDKYYQFAQDYAGLQDNKKALEYYNKFYNEIKGKDDYNEYLYHKALATLYLNQGHLNQVAKEIAQAQTIASTFDDQTLKWTQLEINYLKFEYFKDTNNLELAKQKLDETRKIFAGETRDDLNIFYLDYYVNKKDKANYTKYLNKIKKSYESYPDNSVGKLFYQEYEINLAQRTGDFQTADKISQNILKQLEPYKEDIPVLYAKYLKRAFENKIALKDTIAAKAYLDTALEYYQKSIPINSYEYAWLNIAYGDFYYSTKDFNKAAIHYNKALTYALNAQRDNDAAVLYRKLAYTSYKKGDNTNAKIYIDKAINKNILCYGESSSKTYDSKMDKYRLYKDMGLENEAKTLINEINNIVEYVGITGDKKVTGRDANIENAKTALNEKHYEKALEYTDEVLKNSDDKAEKREAYGLYYNIYNETGNKFKAFKYKKLGHIKK